MTKAIDETWKATELGHVSGPSGDMFRGDAWEGPPDMDRARLRRAGHGARVLLRLEWSGDEGDCPMCGAWESTLGHAGQHAPDCALAAALQKAGVR